MNVYENNSSEEPVSSDKGKSNDASKVVQRPAVPFLPVVPTPMQLKQEGGSILPFNPVNKKENNTGLSENLQTGIEKLSGTDLSDVRVHFNSSQPAQYKAYAYAQSSDIHVAPGMEQHLPHEAWHVAQQKQGRVQATTQLKGIDVNDDVNLEKEADEMGSKAAAFTNDALASGFEQYNKTDISDIRGRSALVSPAQRQVLDGINNEISAPAKKMNGSGNVRQLVAGKFLVDDGAPLAEGQQHKSTFLASLRADVSSASKDILEPAGLAQNDCPDLNYWISYYQQQNAAYVEQALSRYAPATESAANATDFVGSVVQRVREGLTEHMRTGSLQVEPGEAPPSLVEKRLPVITQRKEAPVQFGLSSAAKTEPVPAVQDLNDRLKTIKGIQDPETQCLALCALFGFTDPNDQLNADDWSSAEKPTFVREYTTKEGRQKIFNVLSGCSATADMVLEQLFGKEVGKDKSANFGKSNPRKPKTKDAGDIKARKEQEEQGHISFDLLEGNPKELFEQMDVPGKVMVISLGGGHIFTIASISSGIAMPKESKDKAVESFLAPSKNRPAYQSAAMVQPDRKTNDGPKRLSPGEVASTSTSSGSGGASTGMATEPGKPPVMHLPELAHPLSMPPSVLTGSGVDNKTASSGSPVLTGPDMMPLTPMPPPTSVTAVGDDKTNTTGLAPAETPAPSSLLPSSEVIVTDSSGTPLVSGQSAITKGAVTGDDQKTTPSLPPVPLASASLTPATSLAMPGPTDHSGEVHDGIDDKDGKGEMMHPPAPTTATAAGPPMHVSMAKKGKIPEETKDVKEAFPPSKSPVIRDYLKNVGNRDEGATAFYLYQGWVREHTILDTNFTKRMTAEEFKTFLKDIISSETRLYYFKEDPGTVSELKYKIYDLPVKPISS